MMKKISSLLLALVLVLSFSAAAFAADSTVTFKGLEEGWEFQPGSEYTDSDLFDGFKGVMPGDKLTETVSLKNEASDCDYIKVYLKVLPHDEEGNPLSVDSSETVATMADFLAQLTMRVYNGQDLIYEASPDKAGALADHVLLGTLFKGDSIALKVELDVPAELGNKYANRVGEVDWVFLAEGFDYEKLTVHKVWDDNSYPERPESVTVTLLKDGEPFEKVTLSEENQWTYTWDQLEELSTWTVEETEVPELYEVSYETKDTTVFITNFYDYIAPPEPVDLAVKKVWDDQDNKLGNRPDSVTVTLYNGSEAIEKVVLSEKNGWSYAWEDLDGSGDWSVLETGIPKDYIPSYSEKDGVVTITNTESLAPTGQLNWPIPVLGSLGLLLVLFGAMTLKKKKTGDA